MFITDEDYNIVCGEESLDILSQSEEKTRKNAERVAMEEVSSYLRSRYDLKKAFGRTGDDRNALLVQVTVNIALYYMVHWLPQSMGIDGYKELYDDAIVWLTKVQKGVAQPDLPMITNDDGTESSASNPFRFGSMDASKYDY